MAFPRIGGTNLGFSVAGGLVRPAAVQTSVSGVTTQTQSLNAGFTNTITLAASEIYNIFAGTYLVVPGPYTSLQWLDPVSTRWVTINGENSVAPSVIDSDGANYRLANLTGTPVGAIITNAGAAGTYTNGIGQTATGCTVTISSGASVWVPVVGGQLNNAPVISASGSGYLYPPIVLFDAPPAGGIQATGHTTISGGVVQTLVIDNPGAGYTTGQAPNVTIINDPRDTVGSGASITPAGLGVPVASGQLTALYPSNPGNVTVNPVPTFTFSPASTTAATVVMNYCIVSAIASVSGAGYQSGSFALLMTNNMIVSATNAASGGVFPITDKALTNPRPAMISLAASSTSGSFTALGATGAVFMDNGFGIQAVPTIVVIPGGTSVPTTAAVFSGTYTGVTDTSFLQPI